MTVLPKLERELLAAHERSAGPRRRTWPFRLPTAHRGTGGWLAPAFAVAATVVIVAVFLVALRHGSSPDHPVTTNSPAAIVLEPTVSHPAAGLGASMTTLERRFAAALPSVRVSRVGDQVVLHGVTASNRAQALALTRTGHLAFFDWEASVVTPNGQTVASQLKSGDATAMALSQGLAGAPGAQGSGGLSLYAAVRLASRQQAASPPRSQLYMFGAPGSSGCAWATRILGRSAIPGQPCYLAGPAPSFLALTRGLPTGSAAGGHVLTVPGGVVVLQAADAGPSRHLAFDNPEARFFVLRGRQLLSRSEVTNPTASREPTGDPAVSFDFTAAGRAAFQRVTGALAHRGALVSAPGQDVYQHFAVALDDQLISVPAIDFKQYPDGINGSTADLTGNLTAQGARDLAAVLRYGPLAVSLTPR